MLASHHPAHPHRRRHPSSGHHTPNRAGELFAECPVPTDKPLVTAVEPVVDSSRYYVLQIVDRDSQRHAFIGARVEAAWSGAHLGPTPNCGAAGLAARLPACCAVRQCSSAAPVCRPQTTTTPPSPQCAACLADLASPASCPQASASATAARPRTSTPPCTSTCRCVGGCVEWWEGRHRPRPRVSQRASTSADDAMLPADAACHSLSTCTAAVHQAQAHRGGNEERI